MLEISIFNADITDAQLIVMSILDIPELPIFIDPGLKITNIKLKLA